MDGCERVGNVRTLPDTGIFRSKILFADHSISIWSDIVSLQTQLLQLTALCIVGGEGGGRRGGERLRHVGDFGGLSHRNHVIRDHRVELTNFN